MWNAPDPQRFHPLVWEIVRHIPHGKVSTYGQIASMIPPAPNDDPDRHRRLSPRWVGHALRSTPDAQVPWHRVINSQGGISLPAGSREAITQQRRLMDEGVQFDRNGKVDFDLCGWAGPDDCWLNERGLYPPIPLGRTRLL